jgi:subtilisin family serine protease
MDALLWELLAEGSPNDRVEVLIKLSDLVKVPSDNIEIVAQIGNIASCRIRRGDIETVRGLEGVLSMKASKTLSIDLPYAEDQIDAFDKGGVSKARRQVLPFTGKNIAVGIADWGIDFTHPNFIHPDKSTRFIAIWHQGADYDGKNAYGYGAIYYKTDINDALDADNPFQYLGYHPGMTDTFHQGMHGTHVLDIAAGNGSVGEAGIAPNADLIAVHLATNKFKDLMGLGDSVRVFDAIHFLDTEGGEQPLVINMSVGSHGDAHAGVSLIEQAIDSLVTSKPDRAVVQSCGNYFKGRTHTQGVLTEGSSTTLEWLISEQDKTPNELEIWYAPKDTIKVTIQSPNGEVLIQNQGLGRSNIINKNGDIIGRYYHRAKEPNTQLNQILIILDANASSGKWQVILHAKEISEGRYEAWVERDVRGKEHQSRFSLYQANPNTTTGSICNGFHTICVGAFDANDTKNRIGLFSSVGPTWDGREKPDLAAPGVNIRAAKSASPFQKRSTGELTLKTGTSMAAPYVTGAVALLFEASRYPLSIEAIKQALFKACVLPIGDNPQQTPRYGHGIFKIEHLFPNPIVKTSIIQPAIQKKMENPSVHPDTMPIEALLESYQDMYPELDTNNLVAYFDSLPLEREAGDGFKRGDLVVRRQYGHPEPAWYGVVESVEWDEARVRTTKGVKRVPLTKSGGRMNWEIKKIRPHHRIKNQAPSNDEPNVDSPTTDLEKNSAGSDGDEPVENSPFYGSNYAAYGEDLPVAMPRNLLTTNQQKYLYDDILRQVEALPTNKKNRIPKFNTLSKTNLKTFDITNKPTGEHIKYSVIEYIAGENNLFPFAVSDLLEMIEGNISGNIGCLCLADFADNEGLFVLEVTNGRKVTVNNAVIVRKIEVIEHWKVNKKNDLDAILVFLTRALATYKKVSHKAIGLWGHGTQAYYSSIPEKANFRDLLFLPDDNADARGGEQMIALNDLVANFDRIWYLNELHPKKSKDKLDILFFDVCLLQTAEASSLFEPFTHTYMASENNVPGEGLDYKNWFSDTIAQQPADAQAWVKLALNNFEKYYKAKGDLNVTMSAVDTSKVMALNESMHNFCQQFLLLNDVQFAPYSVLIEQAFSKTLKFPAYPPPHPAGYAECTIDISDFMYNLVQIIDDQQIKDLAIAVYTQIANCIVKNVVGTNMKAAQGLAIWFPKKNKLPLSILTDKNSQYPKIDFVKNTEWLEFCLKYLNASTSGVGGMSENVDDILENSFYQASSNVSHSSNDWNSSINNSTDEATGNSENTHLNELAVKAKSKYDAIMRDIQALKANSNLGNKFIPPKTIANLDTVQRHLSKRRLSEDMSEDIFPLSVGEQALMDKMLGDFNNNIVAFNVAINHARDRFETKVFLEVNKFDDPQKKEILYSFLSTLLGIAASGFGPFAVALTEATVNVLTGVVGLAQTLAATEFSNPKTPYLKIWDTLTNLLIGSKDSVVSSLNDLNRIKAAGDFWEKNRQVYPNDSAFAKAFQRVYFKDGYFVDDYTLNISKVNGDFYKNIERLWQLQTFGMKLDAISGCGRDTIPVVKDNFPDFYDWVVQYFPKTYEEKLLKSKNCRELKLFYKTLADVALHVEFGMQRKIHITDDDQPAIWAT